MGDLKMCKSSEIQTCLHITELSLLLVVGKVKYIKEWKNTVNLS